MSNIVKFPTPQNGGPANSNSERFEDWYARIPRAQLEKEANKLNQEIAGIVWLIGERINHRITTREFDDKLADMDSVVDWGYDPDEVKEAFREGREGDRA